MGNSTDQMTQALQSSGALEFIGNRICKVVSHWNIYIYIFFFSCKLSIPVSKELILFRMVYLDQI